MRTPILPFILIVLAVAGTTAHELPRSVEEANAELNQRRARLIEFWHLNRQQEGIGEFGSHGKERSFRRIVASLETGGQNDFPALVEEWTRSIHKIGHAGSEIPGGEPGDFDMYMKEMISLLYYYKDRPDKLTTQACFNIIDGGLKTYIGPTPKYLFPILFLDYPETENHILMTESCRYLTNQWIWNNPRNDERLRQGDYGDVMRFYNPGSELEDLLLQALGRIVHCDFFETNARPYQALSLHAIMNLYAFAESPRIRIAARNALDFAATKFAFQSFEGKRLCPQRRNTEYAGRLDLYENDHVTLMMGMLSGMYRWNDDPNHEDCFFSANNSGGHALWAMLLGYRLPDAVHDYIIDKHQGYWARMQARITRDMYRTSNRPKYFRADGTLDFTSGNMEYAQEMYFATRDFMNIAGGKFNDYPLKNLTDVVDGANVYDFIARPHVLMTKGLFPGWGDSQATMTNDVLNMVGQNRGSLRDRRWWVSDNIGTYKSFSYGYYYTDDLPWDEDDRHLDWPMSIPPSWAPHRYREGNTDTFGSGRAAFAFYDLRSLSNHGFYVVVARMSKSRNLAKYRLYARGFWEVVPRDRFTSVAALKSWVMAQNPPSHYNDTTSGDSKWYRYKMTTGEKLKLNIIVGFDDGEVKNPIMSVTHPQGWDMDLADVATDRTSQTVIESLPLLDVREVDANYLHTGRVLARAGGDGHLWVTNPHRGSSLQIHSSDYRQPFRTDIDPELPEAVDYFATTLVRGGDASWTRVTDVQRYFGDSARSGRLVGDNQSSWFETTVNGTGIIFDWKVSSEAVWDKLRVLVDGVVHEEISGEVDWTVVSIALSPGSHVVRWEYSKDVSLTRGADCGWVDWIEVYGPAYGKR